MNKIIYGDYAFFDKNLLDLKLYNEISPIGETLAADTMTFTLDYDATANSELWSLTDQLSSLSDELYSQADPTADLSNYIYGTPIYYYKDSTLEGKFFIKKISQVGATRFKFECVSVVGLLIKINHYGGLYEPHEVGGVTTNWTAGEVIADIFSNIGYVEGVDYTIQTEAKNCTIFGHLPIASCRDNLQQVLFAIGANIFKDSNGNIHIAYNEVSDPETISSDKLYIGGSINFLTPATKVNVTEHIFYKLEDDPVVTLFDNTDGTGTAFEKLITFDNPCHDLDFGTLEEIASGINYAIISGTGTLTGQEYTHTRRVLSLPTGASGEPYEVNVENATLVSNANSSNVAQRVANYYGMAKEVSYGIKVDNERCGDYIQFVNPFGKTETGIIRSMDNNVSSITKAESIIATNFIPSNFGNNFTNFDLITTGTSWTAPKSGTLRIVLASGGKGGQAGNNGENGHQGTGFDIGDSLGGAGGLGGNGGTGGYINVLDLPITEGTTYQLTIGEGGVGGTTGGALGTDGTHSTITIDGTTYTSADGYLPDRGYVNALTGEIYSLAGEKGMDGGDGGHGGFWQYSNGQDGFNVTYLGVTYTGGRGGLGYVESDEEWFAGGGGGGACAGSNGSDSYRPPRGYSDRGANGGNAVAVSVQASIGCGGHGGNGGGGGGGGGAAYYWFGGDYGYGGTGGSASAGGQGYIIIYY